LIIQNLDRSIIMDREAVRGIVGCVRVGDRRTTTIDVNDVANAQEGDGRVDGQDDALRILRGHARQVVISYGLSHRNGRISALEITMPQHPVLARERGGYRRRPSRILGWASVALEGSGCVCDLADS
jgi:hypothetical protein